MSKVVHLSDESHAMAKTFCKANSLRMSDWVASLIEAAVRDGVVKPASVKTVPVAKKKKPLLRYDEGEGGDTPTYALPPFWAKSK